MHKPIRPSTVPVHQFQPDEATGSRSFTLVRLQGELVPYMLLPHRKGYYLLFFVQRTSGRHWVDIFPYERQDNTLYFTNPAQLTYLSRLYREQLPDPDASADQHILQAYQAQVEESFHEVHEVSAYAAPPAS